MIRTLVTRHNEGPRTVVSKLRSWNCSPETAALLVSGSAGSYYCRRAAVTGPWFQDRSYCPSYLPTPGLRYMQLSHEWSNSTTADGARICSVGSKKPVKPVKETSELNTGTAWFVVCCCLTKNGFTLRPTGGGPIFCLPRRPGRIFPTGRMRLKCSASDAHLRKSGESQ